MILFILASKLLSADRSAVATLRELQVEEQSLHLLFPGNVKTLTEIPPEAALSQLMEWLHKGMEFAEPIIKFLCSALRLMGTVRPTHHAVAEAPETWCDFVDRARSQARARAVQDAATGTEPSQDIDLSTLEHTLQIVAGCYAAKGHRTVVALCAAIADKKGDRYDAPVAALDVWKLLVQPAHWPHGGHPVKQLYLMAPGEPGTTKKGMTVQDVCDGLQRSWWWMCATRAGQIFLAGVEEVQLCPEGTPEYVRALMRAFMRKIFADNVHATDQICVPAGTAIACCLTVSIVAEDPARGLAVECLGLSQNIGDASGQAARKQYLARLNKTFVTELQDLSTDSGPRWTQLFLDAATSSKTPFRVSQFLTLGHPTTCNAPNPMRLLAAITQYRARAVEAGNVEAEIAADDLESAVQEILQTIRVAATFAEALTATVDALDGLRACRARFAAFKEPETARKARPKANRPRKKGGTAPKALAEAAARTPKRARHHQTLEEQKREPAAQTSAADDHQGATSASAQLPAFVAVSSHFQQIGPNAIRIDGYTISSRAPEDLHRFIVTQVLDRFGRGTFRKSIALVVYHALRHFPGVPIEDVIGTQRRLFDVAAADLDTRDWKADGRIWEDEILFPSGARALRSRQIPGIALIVLCAETKVIVQLIPTGAPSIRVRRN